MTEKSQKSRAMVEKKHKVTGEIVIVDVSDKFGGAIPPAHFAMIQKVTAANSDYEVTRWFAVVEEVEIELTKADLELIDYCDSREKIEKAMGY